MSSKVEVVAAKLNAKGKLSRILESRGTEITDDKVIALDLSSLNISDLPAGVFDELLDLKRLNLGYNKLTRVDSNVFSKLSNLTFLSFFTNQINEFPDDFLTQFPNLEWLDLRGNGLMTIPPSVLELKKLQYLYLQNNPDLTGDEYDFSEDYHSKRDVAKFAEAYQKATGPTPSKPAATKKAEKEESSE
ncbi:MAG: leucine-rich repeat domain-containing protein [Candidatus Kariarchaeaceae archaeon]